MIQSPKDRDGQWLSPSIALSRFDPPAGISPGRAPPDDGHPRYGFRVGGIGLLIAPATACEVIDQAHVYPIPNTPYWLEGLVNLRGNLTPIFALGDFLQLEDGAPSKRMVLILGKDDDAVGVRISDLPLVPDTNRRLSCVPPLPAPLRDHVSGAYVQDGGLWLEFDHRGFFESLAAQIAA